jgi:aspartate kinase
MSIWHCHIRATNAMAEPIRQFGRDVMSEGALAGEPVAVIKIGGSILINARAYRRAALFVRNRHRISPKERLVVVVSAQKDSTDALEDAAKKITDSPDPAALDILWSTGELRSVALLTLHLQALGVPAVAVNIHEAGLTVPENERDAITGHVQIQPARLREFLRDHSIAIVPGFFAIDAADRVVSLGRGGSDLTAVLLAIGLEASRCELLKDVAGYFTSDPHRNANATHVPFLSFQHGLKLADEGCDLVQRKAIEAAARRGLPLVIRSLDEKAHVSRISDVSVEISLSDPVESTAEAS